MNKQFFLRVFKRVHMVLFYVAIFFYTLTFSTSVSWFILYFFTFLFIGSYVSTLVFLGKAQAEITKNTEEKANVKVLFKTRGFWPILLPYMRFTLAHSPSSVIEKGTLFKSKIHLLFPDVHFSRGHHDFIRLQLEGTDFFHIFTHSSELSISVSFDVFPEPLSQTQRQKILKKLDVATASSLFSSSTGLQLRQLREHRQQDAMKDIDWKTSFKKRQLMVKEYDQEIQSPLTIYFCGYSSSQFEELLRLTYSLYLDLAHRQNTRFYLIGNFAGALQTRQDIAAFLAIQPFEHAIEFSHLIGTNQMPQGKKIIVAPQKLTDTWKLTAAKETFFLTEQDLL